MEKEKKLREKEEEEGRSGSFFLRFPAFRLSEYVGPRVKVRPLNKGYALRGRNFSLVDCLFV